MSFHLSISFLKFQASLLKNPTLYLGSSSNFTGSFLLKKTKGGSMTSLLEREEVLSTASLAGINAKLGIGKVFWEQLPMTEIEAHWAFCRGHWRAKIRTKAPSKVFASGGVLLFLQDHLPYTLALTALTWLSRKHTCPGCVWAMGFS